MNRMQFFVQLAEAIRPRNPKTAADALGKMMPELADLPDELFTDETLGIVASRVSRSPTLVQLRRALEAAGRRSEALHSYATTDGADLNAGDINAIRNWNLRRSEGFREVAERDGKGGRNPDPNATPQRFLSMLRSYIPRAYRAIVASDVFAADIAMRAGWLHAERDGPVTEEESAYVAQRVAEAMHAIRMANSPYSPTVNEMRDEVAPPPAGPRPLHLSPEQLDEVNPLPGGRKRVPELLK